MMRDISLIPSHKEARRQAVRWSRFILTTKVPVVILDTETTGLDDPEAVQIAVLSVTGQPLMNTLVKPAYPHKLLKKSKTGKSAYDIHGIHPDRLVAQRRFSDIGREELAPLVNGKIVVIYNADYDWPILLRNAAYYGYRNIFEPRAVHCAMKAYAGFYGEWNPSYRNHRWQKLPAAQGVKAHDALGDCLSTLKLIRDMAETVDLPEADRV